MDQTDRRRTPNITIATIAKHMGLSRATVTHVLNGRAEEQRIRPETKRRVIEVARDMGYRSNASARAIRSGRFGNIAFVQSLLGQYIPRELLRGLMKAIEDVDMHLVLEQVPDMVIDDESFLSHTIRDLSADGLLVYRHVGFSQSFLEHIQKLRIPAIYLNVRQEFDCIHPDDLRGGQMGTEFLLKLGHERIAYVDTEASEDPEEKHYSKQDRREGYEKVIRGAGKEPWIHVLPVQYEVAGKPGYDPRVESAKLLLAGDDRPTAVIAYELTEAMATVNAAQRLGLRIPEDLSVILFHNRRDARYFVPFNTISNVMEPLGKEAVGMLLNKIENPDVPLPARAVPMKLLEGGTCIPLKK